MTAAALRRDAPEGGESNPKFASVARGGMVNMLGAAVSAVVNLALVVVVAHGVDQNRAGEFFALTSVFLVAETLCRLGADTGLIYFVARWRALGQQRLIRAGLRVALVPAVSLAVFVAGAVILFAPWIVDTVVKGSGSHGSVVMLRTLAIFLPAAVLYDLVIGATRGFDRMRPTVVVDKVGRPILQLALVSLVLLVGWQDGLGVAWVLPYLAAVATAVWMLERIGVQKSTPGGRAEALHAVRREFWQFTAPRAAAGVAQILMQRLDIVLVAALAGLKAAALYTAATRFVVVGQFVNQAVSAPVQPRLSALLAAGDRAGAKALYRVSTTWLVLVSWPVFGACIALAPTYLVLFGHGYHEAVAVVVVLSASMLLASTCGLVDSVVIMAGRTSWNLGTTIAALGINVVADLVLIPPYGIVGAAAGWCAGIAAANLVPLALAWRGLGLHPCGRSLGLALMTTGGCFVVLPIVISVTTGSQVATAGALLLGAALYAAMLWRARGIFELGGMLRRRVHSATQ
ncbi:MAG: lipopolysaccharide biosynthesis protein [Jatrophihabitans sp.]